MKTDRGRDGARAWGQYWAKQGKPASGCLPELPTALADDLLRLWNSFFQSLSHGSRLLDLGTGNGALLVQAGAARPDLELTGVDYAVALSDPGPGITLHPNTRMEKLPFADDSIDAITSQFAIEYGNVSAAAGEARRVLGKGGRFLFLCHHADGIIVRDNSERLEALRGLLAPGGLMETANKLVRKGKVDPVVRQRKLARLFAVTLRKYDGQSAVHEVGGDIARIGTETDGLKKLLLLRREVKMECLRLEALKKAALTEKSARELAALLGRDGQQVQVEVMNVPGVAFPLAWRIGN